MLNRPEKSTKLKPAFATKQSRSALGTLLKESFKASEALCDITLDCVESFLESTHLHGQIFAHLLDSMTLNFNLLCHKLQLGLQLVSVW